MKLVFAAVLLCVARGTTSMTIGIHNSNNSILLRRLKRQDLEANMTFIKEFLKGRERTDIIFPGPVTSKLPRIKVPTLDAPPPCAGGDTFCENIDSYPGQALEEVLKRSQVDPEFFGEDETEIVIVNRNTGVNEETFICKSSERTIFPKVGKTKSNKWRYIINQDDSKKYIQGVRIETCRSPGEPCDLIDAVPLGFVTSCKQKYVYRRLLTLQNNEPAKDYFEMPSACCCSYKRDPSFLSTFGTPVSPPRRKKG